MSNSTTTLDLISASQSAKEVTANALFDAYSPSANFGRRSSTTSGLTWGFYGATISVSGTPTQIANGTIALTASATNYLYATSAGVVTKVTSAPSGWPGPLASGAVALYQIVTGASSVTSYTDYRLSSGARGPAGPADDPWVTLTDGATVNVDASLGHNFKWTIGGNRTLANPTNLANGQALNIRITQDGTGSRLITWGSKYKHAQSVNVLSTPANSVDIYSGIYDSTADLIYGVLAKAIA